jgi:hypothetical protein
MECNPADVDDLLKKVTTPVGETRDGMLGRLIDEINGDLDNRNSWIPLGLNMLWFACNQELENPKGFGHHALRRAKEGGVSICFAFKELNYTQWEIRAYCHPQRRKGSHTRLPALIRQIGNRPPEVFWAALIDTWDMCDATWWLKAWLLDLMRNQQARPYIEPMEWPVRIYPQTPGGARCGQR